jgi:hypothetical protein
MTQAQFALETETPTKHGPMPRVSQEAFDIYHAENPQVYRKLLEFAWQAKRSGARRIGIGMLYERLRWYTSVEAKHDPFKVNNNFRSFYARKMMADYPELDGLFELRSSVADQT